MADPTWPFIVCPAVIIGAPAEIVTLTLVGALLPAPFDAVMVAVEEPMPLGVPLITPVDELIDMPVGNPVAVHEIAGRSRASSMARVAERGSPTLPLSVCPAVMRGAPMAIEIVAASVSEPPGPVAVSVIVAVSTSCGVPVIWPVVGLIEAQLGNPVALHEVAGRLAESARVKVLLKAVPTLPEAVWPGVMIGAPPAMVKPTLVASLVPPEPVAVMLELNKPAADGVPKISPESLIDSPAGKLVALHEVAGRSEASSKDRAWKNISPTLPVNVCPLVMIGAPMAIEIVAVSELEPPGPVAVSVIVVLPLSCGVPVIWPVVGLIEAQLGNPVALHEVTGRFVESVSVNVLLNAVPTLPDPVWPAVIIGVPAEISKKTCSKPPSPVVPPSGKIKAYELP